MKKVVIIEDDVLLGRHFVRLCEQSGFVARLAGHAIDGMEMIDEVTPDVIVADMLLTGSTIVPLLHELQTHHDLAHIPVVIVTNTTTDTATAEALRPYGVKRILDKSTMEPSDLVAAIRSVTHE